MSEIFISYARSTAAQARAAAQQLRALGYDVWFDEELPAHRVYGDVIEEHVVAAKAVVVIWSAEAVRSEWVRSEANAGREARKLVQLSVDGTKLPMPFDQIQCADLRDWHGDRTTPGWLKVVASIAELTGVAPAAQGDSPRTLTASLLRAGVAASAGERKTVTVLCAELKVASELRDEVDPEDALAIVEPARRMLIETVGRYDGYVVPGSGAGMVVLFGAPLPHEDHSQQALYAALRVQEELKRYAVQLRATGQAPLDACIGVSSGEVVVRAFTGRDGHTEYSPSGHAANRAARLQALAPASAITVDAQTFKLVEGYFELRALASSGNEPVNIYEVTGLGPLRTRLQRSAGRGYTRFVGRRRELEAMQAAATKARAGRGQIVAAMAEPGVGKSRLMVEFKAAADAVDWTVLEAFSVAHAKASSYVPLIELLHGYFGVGVEDDASKRREKIRARIAGLDPALEGAIPYLYSLLGITQATDPLAQMDVQARQQRTHDAIKRILLRESLNKPLLVIFEDLHWIDEGTQGLLNLLADSIGAAKILLLVNYRPEYADSWRGKTYHTQLRLDPLGQESAQEMLNVLLGDGADLAQLKRLIITKTEGNPFFIEETVRTLFDEGVLVRDGTLKLARALNELKIPPTVQAILAARIDRLEPDSKDLLQTLAVIGTRFRLGLISQVAAKPGPKLEPLLAQLQLGEFIYEQPVVGDIEYAFRHALTHDVAYNSVLKERRRMLHGHTAVALESIHGDHLEDHVAALLAHHWEKAGQALVAARWHRRAAEWVGRTDFVAAVRHLERVRALSRELTDDREAAALGIAACTQTLNVGWRIGMGLDEAHALMEEGQMLASAIGDRRAHLRLSIVYSRALCSAGALAKYLEVASENRRAALEIDDIALQANAWAYLVDALVWTQRFPEALQTADEGLARFPRHIPPEQWLLGNPYCVLSYRRGYCLTWMGRLPEGFEELNRCRRVAQEDDAPDFSVCVYALFAGAEAHYHAHDANRALACACQAEEITNALGAPAQHVALTQFAFAYAHLTAGRAEDAIESARAAVDSFVHVDKATAGLSASLLAEALLQAGDLPAAQTAAAEAIALCRRQLAPPHGVMARVLLRREGATARGAVEALLARAATLIERTGARTLGPVLCEWRAELAGVLGDDMTRKQLLREAEHLYQEIGAPLQVERLTHKRAP